jgi:hypothetical protein
MENNKLVVSAGLIAVSSSGPSCGCQSVLPSVLPGPPDLFHPSPVIGFMIGSSLEDVSLFIVLLVTFFALI